MAANSDVSHRQYTLPKRLTEAKIKAQMDTQSRTHKRKSTSSIPTLNVLRRQARNAVKSVSGQKAPRISKAARDMFSDINKTEILRAIHGNSNAFTDDKTDIDAINATRAAREELNKQRAKQSHIIPVKKRLYRREEEEKEEEEKQEKKRQEKHIEIVEEESDSEAENEERERQAKAVAANTNTDTVTDATQAPTSSPAPASTSTSSPSYIPTPGLHIDALDPNVFNEKDIRNRRMVRLAFQHVVEQRRGEEIEQTIYNKFGLGPDFLSKARHLAENLNLAGNAQLLARVRAGEIPVSDLVSMSFQELSKYNTELTQQRAADHDEMMKATVIPSEQETAEKLKQVALLQKTMITR